MRRVGVIGLFWAMTATSAIACPPPPLPPAPSPGETAAAFETRVATETAAAVEHHRQWRLKAERDALDRAATIVVAQINRVSTFRAAFNGPGQRSHMQTVAVIRGRNARQRFTLSHTGQTTCGPYGGGEATGGKVGDRFVVFATNGPLGNRALIDSVALSNIVDPHLRSLIDATGSK